MTMSNISSTEREEEGKNKKRYFGHELGMEPTTTKCFGWDNARGNCHKVMHVPSTIYYEA